MKATTVWSIYFAASAWKNSVLVRVVNKEQGGKLAFWVRFLHYFS